MNKRFIIALSSIVVVFGGIFLADFMGFWSTTSTGDSIGTDKEEVVLASADELRGSTTFDEIERSFGIPAEILAKAYNFNTSEPGLLQVMVVSDAFAYLGEDVEMGTGSVRQFIYLYNGLDLSSLDAFENIPSTAVDVLKSESKWTDEYNQLMGDYIVLIDAAPMDDTELTVLAGEEHEEESADVSVEGAPTSLEINGKTTVQDIIDAGLSLEEIEASMGIDVANVNLSFRDLCDQNGLDFSEEKNEVLALLGVGE